MTDFYSECEDGLKALLQTLTTFFPQPYQVSDDESVLMQGGEYFAILRPGQFPFNRQGDSLAVVIWAVVVDIYVSYSDYKNSWTKFKAFRSAIFNLIMEHPTLEDVAGVFRADVTGDEQAQYLKFSDAPEARPNFIVQTIRVNISQYIKYTSGEF